LLWFLRGETNIQSLVKNGVNIWVGDAYKAYKKQQNDLNQNEFIYKIKTDIEFANKWGELGPIYGCQWRKWKTNQEKYIDQISQVIDELKSNPDSRRLIVNAWNPGELDLMILPPCHISFQLYSFLDNGCRYLSLSWYQRSVDVPLGLPFNISSYGLLLELIAKETGMIPYELIGNLGDCHIYLNQFEGIKKQILLEPYDLPKIKLHNIGINNINFKDIELIDYKYHPSISLPLNN
jgi:thymidylate synthase